MKEIEIHQYYKKRLTEPTIVKKIVDGELYTTWYFIPMKNPIHGLYTKFLVPNLLQFSSRTARLHRLDGPAIEYSDGEKRWFYYGYEANYKEQFYDYSWRKQIEIKEFLL